MYTTFKTLHSYWAYLLLVILLLAVFNALFGILKRREYTARDFRIALFALIISHIQFLLGLVLYFISPLFDLWSQGGVMGDAEKRLMLVEHPSINIIALILITIGYSKHKKKVSSTSKFKTVLIFYIIGLVFLLSRIPWDVWPNW
ncbi:MAG: hypothetical protein HKO92_09380 [Flavobacteriaceae bacterium]|nr:hypothetical protein [Bacteroidia bacterium]NNK83323.1 hypothetical protein [Flavobacteriaceae bacterium]